MFLNFVVIYYLFLKFLEFDTETFLLKYGILLIYGAFIPKLVKTVNYENLIHNWYFFLKALYIG